MNTKNRFKFCTAFTRDAMLARAVAMGLPVCVRASVCLSVTRRYCIETATRIELNFSVYRILGKLWYLQK